MDALSASNPSVGANTDANVNTGITTRSEAIVSTPSDTATIEALVSSTTPTRTSAATSAMHDVDDDPTATY